MRFRYQSRDKIYAISLDPQGERYEVRVDDLVFAIDEVDLQPGVISFRLAGRLVTLYWASDGGTRWISFNGCTYRLDQPSGTSTATGSEPDGDTLVRAPMPGQVAVLQVEVGEQVEKGQALFVLEAMKMEIRISAPRSGQITSLRVSPGEAVERDQVLATVE